MSCIGICLPSGKKNMYIFFLLIDIINCVYTLILYETKPFQQDVDAIILLMRLAFKAKKTYSHDQFDVGFQNSFHHLAREKSAAMFKDSKNISNSGKTLENSFLVHSKCSETYASASLFLPVLKFFNVLKFFVIFLLIDFFYCFLPATFSFVSEI